MRRGLLVSPHFPPINAPDHQRVRMSLPYFEQFGWRPTVLAVRPECVEGVLDPLLAQTLPKEARVARTRALPVRWMRLAGVGSLAYRAMGHLRRAGQAMLRNEEFDLVFFSTTLFPIMSLGPRWQRELGVPYVLDFQDPWLNDYYHQNKELRRPGGWLKYGFSHWLAGRQEPPIVRGARHVVCVSEAYSRQFLHRYPDLTEARFTTLPFGAPELDFASLSGLGVTQSAFDPKDGREHWVYIGRGGADMSFAARAFFMALKRHRDGHPEVQDRLRVHFIGTDYAPKKRARKTIEPLARSEEHTSELQSRGLISYAVF